MIAKSESLKLLKLLDQRFEKSKEKSVVKQKSLKEPLEIIAYEHKKAITIPEINIKVTGAPEGSFNSELRSLFYGFDQNKFLYDRFKVGMPGTKYSLRDIRHSTPVTGRDVFVASGVSELLRCEQMYCTGRYIFSCPGEYLEIMKRDFFLVLGFQVHKEKGLHCIGIKISKPIIPMAILATDELPFKNIFALIEKN